MVWLVRFENGQKFLGKLEKRGWRSTCMEWSLRQIRKTTEMKMPRREKMEEGDEIRIHTCTWSWSPNSTDLYFWSLSIFIKHFICCICQQKNTKDIAGQSANVHVLRALYKDGRGWWNTYVHVNGDWGIARTTQFLPAALFETGNALASLQRAEAPLSRSDRG